MNKIEYVKVGDYLLPNLIIPLQLKEPLGRYGMMRKSFLENHRPDLYLILQANDRLLEHLTEIDETADERVERIVSESLRTNPNSVTDKATQQMDWVRYMNNLKASAEEIVLKELVYSEPEVTGIEELSEESDEELNLTEELNDQNL